MKGWSFEARAARADQLAQTYASARHLLNFFRRLVSFQIPILEHLRLDDQTDVRALLPYFPSLLDLVQRAGPGVLADFGREHLSSPGAQEELLLACWEGNTSCDMGLFYGRVLLQPFAENLASRGTIALDTSSSKCPFCGARPVAAILRGEGEGGKRSLLCSRCSTEWLFRRVVCPNCGCEDKERLPIYTAADFGHVRVKACDQCKTYVKCVDLTKDGRAVPVVDELAAVALDIWAKDHGYSKLETNLLGL